MRAVLVGVLVLAMGSGGVMAQSAGSLVGGEVRAGERITVVTTSGARFSGRLVEDASGAITLRSNGEKQRVTHGDVQRVDRRRNRFLLGPLIGLAAGIAAFVFASG